MYSETLSPKEKWGGREEVREGRGRGGDNRIGGGKGRGGEIQEEGGRGGRRRGKWRWDRHESQDMEQFTG